MKITKYKKESLQDSNPFCPHCLYEYNYLDFDDDEGEMECDVCGKHFEWQAETTVLYSSYADPYEVEV